MSIKTQGFFADEMKNWLLLHTKRNPAWFALAERINELGYELWHALPLPDSEDSWKFTARLLYLRGMMGFQSSVILARHGLTINAGTVLRSTFEDLFCLGASKEDGVLVEKLVAADKHSRKKLARAVVSLPEDMGLDAERAAKLSRLADLIGDDGKPLNVADVAQSAGLMAVYNVYYRSLCQDASHTTVSSLGRLTRTNAQGEIVSFVDGPDAPDVAKTLAYACVAEFYLITVMAPLFNMANAHEKITEIFPEYQRLLAETFPNSPESGFENAYAKAAQSV